MEEEDPADFAPNSLANILALLFLSAVISLDATITNEDNLEFRDVNLCAVR